MPGAIHLETERLRLRRFIEDDAELLVDLDSDPEVMRYINGGRPTPRSEIVDDVLPAFMSYYERFAGYGFWAVEERSSNEFIGWFHLRPRPDTPVKDPELGYRLRRSAWGKGYGTEGSRALVDSAFRDHGAPRVYAETMVVNAASQAVMRKAGLRHIRTFHQDWPESIPGDEHGDCEFAITRDEWLAKQ